MRKSCMSAPPAKAVKPRVGSLHHPATSLLPWPVALRMRFFSALFDVGQVVTLLHRLLGGCSLVTRIGVEIDFLVESERAGLLRSAAALVVP